MRSGVVVALCAICACGRLGYDAAERGTLAFEASPIVQVTTNVEDSDAPDLLFFDDAYTMVFHDSRTGPEDIYFARVELDGSILLAPTVLASSAGNARNARAAFNGSELCAVWADDTTGNPEITYGVLDSNLQPKFVDQLTSDPGDSTGAAVTWTGSEFLLVWDDARPDRQVYRALVDSSGTLVEPEKRVTSDQASSARDPSAATTGTRMSLVWHDFRSDSELFFGELDALGQLSGPEIQLTDSVVPSRFPDMDALGDDFVIVFEDDRSGAREIYLTIVDPAGTTLLAPIQVSRATEEPGHPKVAVGEGHFGVVWEEGIPDGQIVFAAVSADGASVARVELGGGVIAKRPSVAFDGEGYGVAWDDAPTGNSGEGDIFFARVTPAP